MSGRLVILAIVFGALAAAPAASAQSMSDVDRDALLALHVSRGGRAGDLHGVITLANDAGARGLPVRPLTDKIREGVAKRAAPARIEAVIRQMAADLDAADRLAREWAPASNAPAREAAVTLLAEALGNGFTADDARRGLTPDEARELGRQAQPAGAPAVSADTLASAAKGLAFIKDAKLPVADGTVLVAEAARRGYRAYDLLDLGRQIKRRERDYQTGRATLRALRDAIVRGERPEQLFRHHRAEVERPAAVRPVPPTRPDRPVRPEPPPRPERAGRP
jgi:hypothetical protein